MRVDHSGRPVGPKKQPLVPDGSVIWRSYATCSNVEPREILVSLPRLAFCGHANPHDWTVWAYREPVATKHKRGRNGKARGAKR